MQKKIAVIGAGAAGMLAAGEAARKGARVDLYDTNGRPGRKLAITGKGRCNLTNLCTANEFMENVAVNGKFLYSAFNFFGPREVMDFFASLGVELKVERGRRVFPASDRAFDIVDALRKFYESAGARLVKGRVLDIKKSGELFEVTSAGCGGEYEAVILATGGKSYPLTGSDGSGYAIAERLGHTVTPLSPSLVPLEINEKFCAELMGLSLKNVALRLFYKDKCVFSDNGEMLFTHFGISGPLVLSASSHIRGSDFSNYRVSVDLKPALAEEKLDKRVVGDFTKYKNKEFKNSLGELLPKKLIPVFVALSGIAPEKKVNEVTRAERAALVSLFKDFVLTLRRPRPIEEAIITSGGVKTAEINPKTMESKSVKDLYFAGEIIDVDAYTGGYNLQIAFSTGKLAGACAAKS